MRIAHPMHNEGRGHICAEICLKVWPVNFRYIFISFLVYELEEMKFSYFELPIMNKRNVLRPTNMFYGSNSKSIEDMR
jgi:hypothetical protein